LTSLLEREIDIKKAYKGRVEKEGNYHTLNSFSEKPLLFIRFDHNTKLRKIYQEGQ
jgi:hypothetical protein